MKEFELKQVARNNSENFGIVPKSQQLGCAAQKPRKRIL